DPRVTIFNVKTMADRLDTALARPRFYTTTILYVGGLALLLMIMGVYGMVSHAVSQRTREMGVRLALGTTPARLRGLVLKQAIVVGGRGVGPGAWRAMMLGRYLETLVRGAGTGLTIATFAAALIAIVTVAIASWLATRAIVRLDISAILRAETIG